MQSSLSSLKGIINPSQLYTSSIGQTTQIIKIQKSENDLNQVLKKRIEGL
jgi:hypothetical protein